MTKAPKLWRSSEEDAQLTKHLLAGNTASSKSKKPKEPKKALAPPLALKASDRYPELARRYTKRLNWRTAYEIVPFVGEPAEAWERAFWHWAYWGGDRSSIYHCLALNIPFGPIDGKVLLMILEKDLRPVGGNGGEQPGAAVDAYQARTIAMGLFAGAHRQHAINKLGQQAAASMTNSDLPSLSVAERERLSKGVSVAFKKIFERPSADEDQAQDPDGVKLLSPTWREIYDWSTGFTDEAQEPPYSTFAEIVKLPPGGG